MTISQRFRSGAWVTPARVRNYSILFLAQCIFMLVHLALTAENMHDYNGYLLGTDFSNVYAAGTYVQEHRPEAPFDPALQQAREKQLFGAKADFYSWNYPPYFLFVALPLTVMPYLTAWIVYQLATFLAYLAAMRAILPRPETWLPALGFGVVVINIMHGNNGFLTAALFAGALAALPKRPVLAGILFACLVYKPQYGMFIPVALAAAGHWRAFFAAAASVVVLTLLSLYAFGETTWQAFFASADFTRSVLLEQGSTGFFKMQSMFAWVRAVGGSVDAAYAVQGAVLVLMLLATFGIWRSRMDYALKASALMLATLLAVPYSFDYDLMLLAGAITFYVEYGMRKGFPPYAKSLLALCWVAPFFARPFAQHTAIFLGPLCMILLFITLLRQWKATYAR